MSISIAILDLPLGSALTVDGQVLRLQRDDFVGIRDFPTNDGGAAFHLVIARAAVKTEVGGGAGTTPVGFVILLETNDTPPSDNSTGTLALVKRYDATTEEVSSQPVDSTTVSNLEQQLLSNQLEPQRLINYTDIVTPEQQTAWSQATQFISLALLKARKIQPTDKIIPGSYTEEEDTTSKNLNTTTTKIQDGVSIEYPPVPVLQTNMAMARQSQHSGTKRYLATLPPADRTQLFMSASPQALLLEQILQKHYHGGKWQELLGDIQLSYLFFLQLHCLASLEHWRDLVAVVCLVPANEISSNYLSLYTQLLTILAGQILTIDTDFFDEGGDDNFLLPSLQTLCSATERIVDPSLQSARSHLCQLLDNRFPNAMISTTKKYGVMRDSDEDDDDDEDAPVVVSTQDYEASLERSSQQQRQRQTPQQQPLAFPPAIKQQYPILFAAQMDQEDILMTCARALDEKTDVSLVREAADFLVEQVEPSSAVATDMGTMMDE